MKIFILILVLAVVVILIKSWLARQNNEGNNESNLKIQRKLKRLKANDKLVLVKGATYQGLKEIIAAFCKMYNEGGVEASPRLAKMPDNHFIIIFPYDLSFNVYCYFINYLRYPIDSNERPDPVAWMSVTPRDNLIADKVGKKKLMLFIPEDDTDHDCIWLTTDDNVSYKYNFNEDEQLRRLSVAKRQYVAFPVRMDELQTKPFEDFH